VFPEMPIGTNRRKYRQKVELQIVSQMLDQTDDGRMDEI
jgi:hypothetical protein